MSTTATATTTTTTASAAATTETTVRLPKPANLKVLQPLPVHDVSTATDERTKILGQLLQKGHVTVAPLRDPELILHSHLPHLLGAAYGVGADIEQLTKSYEHEITTLVSIDERFVRGDRIDQADWRGHLADKQFTVAYVDFFDEQVKLAGGDWRKVVEEYIYSGPEPLFNGYCGGLGHPFIHLAYAYEYGSKEVATQALSLGCTEYDGFHGLIDHASPDNSTYKTTSLAEVMQRIHTDTRLDGIFALPGITNTEILAQKYLHIVLEHWNAWQVGDDPQQQLEQICDLSVLLAISSGDAVRSFDFFCVHILTVAHAIRLLWVEMPIPSDRHASVLKQFALFQIVQYVNQLRPAFGIEEIEKVELKGRDWAWAYDTALKHKWALDSHFFKVVRAPKVLEDTYGSKDQFYLKAALKFLDEFRGWEGFGAGVAGFDPSKDGYIPE